MLNNKTLDSLELLLEYLTDCEKKHYEESSKHDKINHIKIVKRALKT